MDWGLGHYENLAAQLRPVAHILVERAEPRRNELILDVGCGTGNAALIAASSGARVIGVDPSSRLLDFARTSVMDAGLDLQFVLGDAASLPVPGGCVDAIVSSFGVIFAPDAPAAAAELARVLRPGGRIALSAWLRHGALAEQAQLRRDLLLRAGGQRPSGDLYAWHDIEALTTLLAPHGFSVKLEEHELAFRAESAQAYADAELADHPLWVQARELLEPAGWWRRARDELIELFARANEDPAGFRVTSSYVVAVAAR
jgi:SAM-dependent methyltransferase